LFGFASGAIVRGESRWLQGKLGRPPERTQQQ
jgi:hypothetical protein